MNNNLWLLTVKNLKLLIRAKGSALIVVFAPLLIILILGLSFNNSAKYALNIGVQATSSSSDIEAFISTLQEQEFKVIKYNESKEACIEDVKQGYIHTCIILPESFAIDSNTAREITFYIDPSKINLVWVVQQTLEKKLNLKSQEISQVLAQDIFAKLSDTNTKVAAEKAAITRVKDKSAGAAASTDAAKSGLGKLDLAPPTTEYNTNVITNFKDAVTAKINSGKSKIDSAKSTINSANLSSSAKSAIISYLTEATFSITNASTLLAATSGENSFGEISNLVSTLQTDVSSTKSKLTAASQQIAATSADLEGVKNSINEGVSALESIQKVLEEVNVNLNAQKVTDAKTVSSPLVTKIEKVAPEKTYLNYTFPALLILVIMFSSLLLGTTLVMMEKNSPAFTRNYFLPINKVTFVLSTYLTNLLLILIQLIIILGISLAFLPEIYVSLLPVALILFLAASVFTFLGMAIGYVFISEETAVLASISMGSVLLFMSGLILPLESVSPMFRDIVYFNPFVIAENLVRELLIFQSPLVALWMNVATLFIYALVLFLFILVLESLIHQRVITRFFHHSHQKHKGLQKQVPKGP